MRSNNKGDGDGDGDGGGGRREMWSGWGWTKWQMAKLGEKKRGMGWDRRNGQLKVGQQQEDSQMTHEQVLDLLHF